MFQSTGYTEKTLDAFCREKDGLTHLLHRLKKTNNDRYSHMKVRNASLAAT